MCWEEEHSKNQKEELKCQIDEEGECSGWRKSQNLQDWALTKSQLISECLFGVLNFQKTNEKFDKFLPKNLKSGQIVR